MRKILITIILVCFGFLAIQTVNGNLGQLVNQSLPKEDYSVGILSIPGMVPLILVVGLILILAIWRFTVTSDSRRKGRERKETNNQ